MKDYRRIRQRVAAGECDSRWRRSIGLAARSLSRADHDGWDELTGAVQRPGLSCPVGTPIEVDRGRPPRGGRRGHVRDDGGSPGPDIRLGPHRATMRTMRIQRFRALVAAGPRDRKSTRLNSSHDQISYAVFCLKKKKKKNYILLQIKIKKKK